MVVSQKPPPAGTGMPFVHDPPVVVNALPKIFGEPRAALTGLLLVMLNNTGALSSPSGTLPNA